MNPAKPNAAPRLTPRALTVVAAFLVLAGAALWILMTPSRSGTALIGGPFQLQTAGGKTLTDGDLAPSDSHNGLGERNNGFRTSG